MEQLEKTNNVRFLRQQYVDPMTGKADWRLIHVGEAKTTVKGFFGQPLAGLAPGLGSVAGMASPGIGGVVGWHRVRGVGGASLGIGSGSGTWRLRRERVGWGLRRLGGLVRRVALGGLRRLGY